jgi:hypothetical protein
MGGSVIFRVSQARDCQLQAVSWLGTEVALSRIPSAFHIGLRTNHGCIEEDHAAKRALDNPVNGAANSQTLGKLSKWEHQLQ